VPQQSGAGQVGDSGLQGIEAIVEQKQRVPSEGDSPALWSPCGSPRDVRMARTEVYRELVQRVAPDENAKS
jgi:hypothetical protein